MIRWRPIRDDRVLDVKPDETMPMYVDLITREVKWELDPKRN